MRPLPPKTCSIDRLITRPEHIDRALSGHKRAVRRNGRYADLGEEFSLKGKRFRVTAVYRQALKDMTDADAITEGFAALADFKAYIVGLHQGMEWLPRAHVWVHEFEPIDEP